MAFLRGVGELPPVAAPLFDADIDPGTPDLADVRGQLQARRALEIAAAGRHHLLI